MKILLLSYYFPPDLSAGAFRARALADALIRQGGNELQLDVLTTEPNRYRSHKPAEAGYPESNFRVVRVGLPEQRWGLAGQIRSFGAFARAAISHAPEERYDLVVATSSRLMTAALGTWLAKQKGASFYLDIRDIFVDTVKDVFHPVLVLPLKGALSCIERYAVRRAERVNLVSPGFLPYFQKISAEKSYRFFTNGIDESFKADTFPIASRHSGQVRILYAGNIGHGQGLERILPELAVRLEEQASFTVIGDGATRPQLVKKCREAGAKVTFVDPVSREKLRGYYDKADILFLQLNNLPAFLKVLPSKLFEYAATGKPILAGVDGYSKRFLTEQVEGVGIFQPCDIEGAIKAFESLELANYPRTLFCERYARRRIMDDMALDILEVGQRANDLGRR